MSITQIAQREGKTRANDNESGQALEVGIAETSARRFSANNTPRVKATVFLLPGACRRQVPRCDGCGNPIAAGMVLCEDCVGGTAQMQRVEANRRAANLCRQSMGNRAREGG